MPKGELLSIVAQLRNQGRMKFLGGATAEQIAKFEKGNNFVLPSGYKEWLLLSDGGEFFLPAGVQLYGVAHKPFIDVSEDDRPDRNYVIIGALATGDPILCKIGSEEIAIYNHEADRIESDEIYKDFDIFLSNLPEILGIGG